MIRIITLSLAWLAASAAHALDGFPPEVSEQLERLIARGPGVAVFDADYTLWQADIGEEMHYFLSRTGRLPLAKPGRDLVREYREREEKDPPGAYEWCVLAMAGMPEREVDRWARAVFTARVAPRIHQAQRNLVRRLQKAGWEVWIVSASNPWAVRAGARELGIAPDRVIAATPRVRKGVLQARMDFPMPWGPGKVRAIERFIGRKPDLVCGDSRGDLEMLELSRGLSLLVRYPGKASQAPVLSAAREHGWLTPVLTDTKTGR